MNDQSNLAKARDDFLESPEVAAIIKLCGGDQYAKNRVESVWMSGAGWGMRHPNEAHVTHKALLLLREACDPAVRRNLEEMEKEKGRTT